MPHILINGLNHSSINGVPWPEGMQSRIFRIQGVLELTVEFWKSQVLCVIPFLFQITPRCCNKTLLVWTSEMPFQTSVRIII